MGSVRRRHRFFVVAVLGALLGACATPAATGPDLFSAGEARAGAASLARDADADGVEAEAAERPFIVPATPELKLDPGPRSDGWRAIRPPVLRGPAAKSAATERARERVVAEREAVVESILAAMPLRRRIAQRLITFVPRGYDPAFPASPATERFDTLLAELQPAGVIIYPWNAPDSASLDRLTARLNRIIRDADAPTDLFISADQEGGRVQAFRYPEVIGVPSFAAAARHDDPRYIESLAYLVGRDLMSHGVNMNLAPVLDVSPTADDSIIGDRAWSGDAEAVARYGEAYLRGFSRSGAIPVAKHFPGHGSTRIDSHGRLPILEMTRDELAAADMMPFARAIAAGLPAIMTAHLLFPSVDPAMPVTLSRTFLTDILREELGFEGVVMTDGLEMGAISRNFGIDETLEGAINAGVDVILLYDRYPFAEIVDRIEAAVDVGAISVQQIDAGVRRVLRLKYDSGLIPSIEPGGRMIAQPAADEITPISKDRR